MTSELRPYVPLARVVARLPLVFPAGTSQRPYLVREIAAKTVFVALYIGAVESCDRWFRPNQVTRMTDAQARRGADDARVRWIDDSLRRGEDPVGRWYADNTREPIRDETIRNGLLAVGAIIERKGVPVTSSTPRYALSAEFAALFECSDDQFAAFADAWRHRHLTANALLRVKLRAKSAAARESGVLVTLPHGESRKLDAGPSAAISKAVVEEFGSRWLSNAALVWLSDSRARVVESDEQLAKQLGLRIDASRLLPDIILADLGAEPRLLVFVEVVATSGPIDDARRKSLTALATHGGHSAAALAFVSAFESREGAFRRFAAEIAWDTAVWFSDEPDGLLIYAGTQWRTTVGVTLADVWSKRLT